MSQAQKCLELLNTKLWLIDFEIEEDTTSIISSKVVLKLESRRRHLKYLRRRLIERYNLKV